MKNYLLIFCFFVAQHVVFAQTAKSDSYEHVNKMATHSAFFDNDLEIEKWLAENKVPVLGIGVIKDGNLG